VLSALTAEVAGDLAFAACAMLQKMGKLPASANAAAANQVCDLV
jgi:hypothetical protein